jgi:hypothetical protein
LNLLLNHLASIVNNYLISLKLMSGMGGKVLGRVVSDLSPKFVNFLSKAYL